MVIVSEAQLTQLAEGLKLASQKLVFFIVIFLFSATVTCYYFAFPVLLFVFAVEFSIFYF
jgi:hypothetical protein